MKQTYMIVNELDVNKGGMTTAMLTRSKFFLDNEISGDIITFDFKANYKDILKELVQSKKWINARKCTILSFILRIYQICNIKNIIIQ
ncbi:hypothetical protein AAHH64_04075 [Staphylococcus epidermidis]